MWIQSWSGWIPAAGSPLMRPAPGSAGNDYLIPPIAPRREEPAYWEFFCHNAAIGPWRDTEGRPLGERGFTPLEHLEGVPMKTRRCPYPGSRHHHAKPMNVSALRQQTSHWADFRAALELLRTLYLEVHPPRKSGELAPLELWRMCRVIVRLPQYLHRRGTDSVDSGNFSPLVASILKVVLGASVMLEHLAVRCMAKGLPLPELVTPQFVVDYVEEHGLFINFDGVCAGPPKMVGEFLSALIYGDPSIDVAGRGRTLELQLGETDREVRAFFAYAREDARIKLAKNAFHARSVALGLRLLSLSEQGGVRRSGSAAAIKLDAFEAALKHRAARYLRCFDETEIEALGRELEGESSRMEEELEKPSVLSSADRCRFVDELVDLAGRSSPNLGMDFDVVRLLVEALVEHLLLERSALDTVACAQDSIAQVTGRPSSGSRLDQLDTEALCGPTVGTLLEDLFELEISNTADRTMVRARALDNTVSI